MARQDISQSPLVKAARKKRQKAPGFGAIGIGFAQGINQGMQMGMYRAMQQQKVGQTENEELAKKLKAIPTAGWSSEKKAKLNTTIFALGTDPNLDADDRQVFTDEWLTIIADPATYEPPPKTEEELSAEHAETLRKEVRQRGEPKEPGYTMTAAQVTTEDLPTAPIGQVWWMSADGNPTLKGKATEVAKALKPVRMEHMTTGKAEWFNWDPAQESFVYQSGKNVGEPLSAEELTNYKPPTASAMAELLRVLQQVPPPPP
jgi:hypothetical protein